MSASRPWAIRACAATQVRPALRCRHRRAGQQPLGVGQRAGEDRALSGQDEDLARDPGVGDPSRQGDGLVGVVPHPRDVSGHHEQAEPTGQRPAARDVGRSGPDPLEPGQPFAGVAAQREVEPDAAGELGGVAVAVELEQPQVGRAQVGVVGLEPVERDGEARPLERVAEGRRARVEVRGVPVGGARWPGRTRAGAAIANCRTGSSSRKRGWSSGAGTRSTSDWSTSAPSAGSTSAPSPSSATGLDRRRARTRR